MSATKTVTTAAAPAQIERALDGMSRKRQVAQSAWCAINRYYLNKIAGTTDKTAVIELAHAVGLDEHGWRKSA